MRALLDTHTFLWWNLDDPQLSTAARTVIADGRNTIYLSAVTAWEIAIKAAKGRLTLPEPADRYVAERMSLHADPFDRLLVAQARLEKLAILTADAAIGQYEVEVIW